MAHDIGSSTDLDQAKRLFRAHVCEARKITELPGGRNRVYRITGDDGGDYVLKIAHPRDDGTRNCEHVVYGALAESPTIRRCVARSEASAARDAFTIVEYAEGETLLDVVRAKPPRERLVRLVRQVHDFIARCTAIPTRGFGDVDEGLYGRFASWSALLVDFLDRMTERIATVAGAAERTYLSGVAGTLRAFVDENRAAFDRIEGRLTPVDLNLANFVVTEGDRVVALDLETFWSADPWMALGEWMGHTFGMPAWDAMLQVHPPLGADELRRVHFYAALSNFAVMGFCLLNGAGTLDDLRPWGNSARFRDLLTAHIAAIHGGSRAVSSPS